MVREDWLLEVFDDLAKYAEDNGLLHLRKQISQAKQVAKLEIGFAADSSISHSPVVTVFSPKTLDIQPKVKSATPSINFPEDPSAIIVKDRFKGRRHLKLVESSGPN